MESGIHWWLVPAIFFARVADVSLGTFRSIVIFRGHRPLAAAIGFFEILLWVLAASQVLGHLDAWYLTVAYAGGFSAGTYVGMWVESTVAIGSELVRIVHPGEAGKLHTPLKNAGYNFVTLEARGDERQPAEVIFVVERRKKVRQLLRLIHDAAPEAVVTLSDVKEFRSQTELLTQKPLINAGWRARGKRK